MPLPTEPLSGSPTLRAAFVSLTVFLALLLSVAVYWSGRRTGLSRNTALRGGIIAAVAAAAWIVATGVAASRGVLHFEAPPTMLGLILVSLAFAGALGASPVGKRIALGLPMAALVAYQGFRVVVELLMHRAYAEGLMPVQMSYSGRNFDIVTGVTALLVAGWLALGHPSRRLVMIWNVLGVALLANILGVAVLSAPTPFRVFMNEPSNVWITHAPWVWLPTVMVFAAVFGHVLVFRRLPSDAPT